MQNVRVYFFFIWSPTHSFHPLARLGYPTSAVIRMPVTTLWPFKLLSITPEVKRCKIVTFNTAENEQRFYLVIFIGSS